MSSPGSLLEDANESAPLAMRDTLPAPPSCPGATDSGARRIPSGAADLVRRDTMVGLAPSVPPTSSSPPTSSAPPRSGPPGVTGRYSAREAHDDVVLPAASSRRLAKEAPSRTPRNALRVDEVGTTRIVARQDASPVTTARVVKRTRPPPADLDASDAFVVAIIDRPISVPELIDAAGMPEHEVMKCLGRLVRLGIVAYSP